MRLAAIEEEFGDQVNVEWKSFLLRGEPEPRTMEKFTRYTKSWENPGSMEPRTIFNEWSGDHEPPSHSVPSSVAGKAAQTLGPDVYRAFSMAMFAAYFTENRTISDRSVQLDIAESVGIDRDVFAGLLDDESKTLEQAVWNDYRTAINNEVTAVPSVVVEDQWVLPGALDEEQYRRIVRRALEIMAEEVD